MKDYKKRVIFKNKKAKRGKYCWEKTRKNICRKKDESIKVSVRWWKGIKSMILSELQWKKKGSENKETEKLKKEVKEELRIRMKN